MPKPYSDAATERGPDGHNSLVLFLTEDDALSIYKALHASDFGGGGSAHLGRLIERMYEETFNSRLTEPWEWED